MTTSPELSSQLMIPQTVAAAIETIINKVLALPSANVTLDTLNEKTLTLILAELGFALSFTISASTKTNTIIVSSLTNAADCTINTSLKTLTEIKAKQPLTDLIKQDKLDVVGDLKVAQSFATLAQNLAIDWPSELARHIGDVPTQKLQQLGKKMKSTFAFANQQIQTDVNEYLLHEQRLLVSNDQIEKFNQAVQQVHLQTENLATRIARLTKQL